MAEMTRKEAIGHIKDVICENNTIKPNIVVFEQEKEALYMAISDIGRVEELEAENKRLTDLLYEQSKNLDSLNLEVERLKDGIAKTGHWIDVYKDSAFCSCCNRGNIVYGDFCKWCGAKMVKPWKSEGKE